jgi:lysine 2,3-aminomutase
MTDRQGIQDADASVAAAGPPRSVARPGTRQPRAQAAEQPFPYPLQREFVEPDWRRLPGYRDVTREQWESAQWRRAHSVKNLAELRRALGATLTEDLAADIERDMFERATMSMLIPPQMVNTMDERDLWTDPVRRYMAPAYSERDPQWPSHPYASRDSLHEADMWAVEGLTHRYPTKVLAELLPTCPQYCGHCTRMDLVGNSTPQIGKYKFEIKQPERHARMLDYLRKTPSIRDVVVSGGDVANLPIKRLEEFVSDLLDIEHVRDIRLATKGLMGLPQHFLQPEVQQGLERLGRKARGRDVSLAVHTHVNHANQLTPLVARASGQFIDWGYRDVRNQGVLLRGVNATAPDVLELCFTLLDHAGITPYYFYMCDMIPNSEHWRISVWEAQELQHAIMGYLPGFAPPRIVCDVPFVGKRWVHQTEAYDRERGISYWTKNYRTGIESDDGEALSRRYPYYDPIASLPKEGQRWWRQHAADQDTAGWPTGRDRCRGRHQDGGDSVRSSGPARDRRHRGGPGVRPRGRPRRHPPRVSAARHGRARSHGNRLRFGGGPRGGRRAAPSARRPVHPPARFHRPRSRSPAPRVRQSVPRPRRG